MPPAIGAMVIIFFMIIGYFTSNNLYMVIFFAAMAECLVYIPQFLASVQTMEVVPAFAVGILCRISWLYELCSRRFTWNKSYRLGCGLLW